MSTDMEEFAKAFTAEVMNQIQEQITSLEKVRADVSEKQKKLSADSAKVESERRALYAEIAKLRDTKDELTAEVQKLRDEVASVAPNKKGFLSPANIAILMRSYADDADTEDRHFNMDKLMCDLLRALGYDEAVQIFEDAGKWYS